MKSDISNKETTSYNVNIPETHTFVWKVCKPKKDRFTNKYIGFLPTVMSSLFSFLSPCPGLLKVI